MHQNDRGIKQGDRLLKMQGKLDRGPVEFKSHIVQQEGEIMAIATHDVISVPPTQSIIGAVEIMTKCGFRRLPVTDAGTKKLRGIITSGDVINFMGGGDKYKLVQVRHGGNLLAAVNESVRTIMTQQITTLAHDSRISDAVDIIVKKKIGGLPIIDDDGVLNGIVTERDVLRVLGAERSSLTAEDVMSSSLRVTSPDCTIANVAHDMIQYRFRRLPVVSDDVLYGMITATDIMKYLGSREPSITGNAPIFLVSISRAAWLMLCIGVVVKRSPPISVRTGNPMTSATLPVVRREKTSRLPRYFIMSVAVIIP